jgi:hypothetical protein
MVEVKRSGTGGLGLATLIGLAVATLNSAGCSMFSGGGGGSDSSKEGEVLLYSSPDDTKAKPKFVAGEKMFVEIRLTKKSLLEITQGNPAEIPLQFYAPKAPKDQSLYVTFELAAEKKQDKVIRLPIIDDAKGYKHMHQVWPWLEQFTTGGPYEVEVMAGPAREAVATIQLDMSQGLAPYNAIKTAVEAKIVEDNGNKKLPVAGMTDKDIEGRVRTYLEKEAKGAELLKILIISPEWHLERHEVSGAVLKRVIEVGWFAKDKTTAKCSFTGGLFLAEANLGGEKKWGKMQWNASAPNSGSGEIPCDKVPK